MDPYSTSNTIGNITPFLNSNRQTSKRPRHLVRVVILGRSTGPRDLILQSTQNAQRPGHPSGIGFLKPDVGEICKSGEAAAINRPFQHPVRINLAQGSRARYRDGITVALADIRNRSAQSLAFSLRGPQMSHTLCQPCLMSHSRLPQTSRWPPLNGYLSVHDWDHALSGYRCTW